MNYRRNSTFFILIFVTFFIILSNINQTPAQYYPYPYSNEPLFPSHFDTCHSYLDAIFTIGGIKSKIKIAQSPFDKKVKNDKKYTQPKAENVNIDTALKANRILSIQESEKGDKILIFIEVEKKEQNIKIVIYNLLGKKVLDLYDGQPKEPNQPYELITSDLPKGIFLIVVSGDNFRLRDKLIISR